MSSTPLTSWNSPTPAFQGASETDDWPGSWAKQIVTDGEWIEARAELSKQGEAFINALKSIDLESDPDKLTYAIANLGHAAYHLGAIRQIYLVVTAS